MIDFTFLWRMNLFLFLEKNIIFVAIENIMFLFTLKEVCKHIYAQII